MFYESSVLKYQEISTFQGLKNYDFGSVETLSFRKILEYSFYHIRCGNSFFLSESLFEDFLIVNVAEKTLKKNRLNNCVSPTH